MTAYRLESNDFSLTGLSATQPLQLPKSQHSFASGLQFHFARPAGIAGACVADCNLNPVTLCRVKNLSELAVRYKSHIQVFAAVLNRIFIP